jgi:hypothetical protein
VETLVLAGIGGCFEIKLILCFTVPESQNKKEGIQNCEMTSNASNNEKLLGVAYKYESSCFE